MQRYLLLLALSWLVVSCGSLRPGHANQSSRPKGPKIEHEVLDGNRPKPATRNPREVEPTAELEEDEFARKALEEFVNDWYGVPHRMGGMTKEGVDCSGFVILAYEEIFDREFSGRRAEDLFAEMDPLKDKDLQYGDLVFFKVKGRRIDHVGIYLEDQKFAHTSSSRGVMISSLSNPYWQKRFFRGARYKH